MSPGLQMIAIAPTKCGAFDVATLNDFALSELLKITRVVSRGVAPGYRMLPRWGIEGDVVWFRGIRSKLSDALHEDP